MGKKRGKRGSHKGHPAPKRSAAGRRNQDFNIVKSALRNGRWAWLLKPQNQSLAAQWERLQLAAEDRSITLSDEQTARPQSDREDSPESSGVSS